MKKNTNPKRRVKMQKCLKPLGVCLLFIALMSVPLLAQEGELRQGELPGTKASLYKWALIVGGAIIALASAAGAFCQAKTLSSACEGISRNPGSGQHIRFLVIFGLVLIETLVIYALLISIIILMIQWGKFA